MFCLPQYFLDPLCIFSYAAFINYTREEILISYWCHLSTSFDQLPNILVLENYCHCCKFKRFLLFKIFWFESQNSLEKLNYEHDTKLSQYKLNTHKHVKLLSTEILKSNIYINTSNAQIKKYVKPLLFLF